MTSDPISNIQTRSAIWRMFRDAADEDYLIARIAARHNLTHQFCWSSQQCLEKMLKSILLLNGQEVASYGHDLEPMLGVAQKIAGDLLPIMLCPPREFSIDSNGSISKSFEPFQKYIERSNKNGNANNRYRVFSVVVSLFDLNKLDQAVFLLRRVAFPLEFIVGPTGKTARELLREDRLLQLHPLDPERIGGFESEKTSRTESLNWRNFAFHYDGSIQDGKIASRGFGAINSSTYLLINGDATSLDAIEWIAQNAFPKGLRKEAKDLVVQKRRAKVVGTR